MEYLDIWIPSAVSVLGFAVTIYTVNRKISSISKERIKGERQDLYIELYSQLEELIKEIVLFLIKCILILVSVSR